MDGESATLVWTVQQLLLARYCKVAILTFFVADYFHTLAAEIDSLWPAPWTIVKIVFLISRYSPFIDGPATLAVIGTPGPSAEACTQLLRIELWSAGIGQACSLILLIYRAYALVGRTRLSAILLSLLVLVVIVTDFVFLPMIQRSIVAAGSPGVPDIFPKCFVADIGISTNRLIVVSTMAVIVQETILFGVISWAKVKKYREDRNLLIRKIYKDAFMYYLLLLVISGAGVIVWFCTTGPMRGLSSMPRYFASALSSRIILNIRRYANGHRISDGVGMAGMGETTQPVSGLRFAGGGQDSGVINGLGSY